jgi:hypothetical protein
MCRSLAVFRQGGCPELTLGCGPVPQNDGGRGETPRRIVLGGSREGCLEEGILAPGLKDESIFPGRERTNIVGGGLSG